MLPDGYGIRSAQLLGSSTSDSYTVYTGRIGDTAGVATVSTSVAVNSVATFSTPVSGEQLRYITFAWSSRGGTSCYGAVVNLDGI